MSKCYVSKITFRWTFCFWEIESFDTIHNYNYSEIFASSFVKKITSFVFTENLFEMSTCQLFRIFCQITYNVKLRAVAIWPIFSSFKRVYQFHIFTKIHFFHFSGVAGSAQKPPGKFILNMSGESESCSSAMSSLESVRSSEVKIKIYNKMSFSFKHLI